MRKFLLFFIVLLTAGLLLTGCESDSTAPEDELPVLSDEDVATQSGAMAASMTQVFPRIWEPASGKDNGEYEYTFPGGSAVQGTVYSEFRDVEGGDLVDYDVAGWALVLTEDPLSITLLDGGIPWLLGFTITADIDQAADEATATGVGTLVVGDYNAAFTLDAVVVEDGDDYPASGSITFINEGITAVVTFDGDNLVTVTVGEDSWTVDLDDGSIIS